MFNSGELTGFHRSSPSRASGQLVAVRILQGVQLVKSHFPNLVHDFLLRIANLPLPAG